MTWSEFWIVLAACGVTMLACRVLPLFLLKGRELPPMLKRALGFIPPAAFAALVANDLFVRDVRCRVVACGDSLGCRALRGSCRGEDEVAFVERRHGRCRLRSAFPYIAASLRLA